MVWLLETKEGEPLTDRELNQIERATRECNHRGWGDAIALDVYSFHASAGDWILRLIAEIKRLRAETSRPTSP